MFIIEWFQWVADCITAITKHGWSLPAFLVSLTALLRVNGVRRIVLRRLPKRFRQEDKLDRIERKLDALMSKEGVTWDAENRNLSLNTANSSRKLLRVAGLSALIVGLRMDRIKQIIYSRRMKTLKSKLLSRKFLMAVISAALVIANDGLDLGLDQATIVAFGSIVVGWIVSEAVVDVSGKEKKPEDIAKSYHGE